MTGFACNYKDDNALGAWNDLYLNSAGQIATVQGQDDTVQSVATNVWLNQKEYEFNITIGIPYKKIFNNAFIEDSVIQFYLSKAILAHNDYLNAKDLAIYGIKKILGMQFIRDRNQKLLTINAVLLFNNGTTQKISL